MLYVTSGSAVDPAITSSACRATTRQRRPDNGRHPLPGLGSLVFDEASQQVHILGRPPVAAARPAAGWTVYVIEPHADAVYADAPARRLRAGRLGDGREPEYQAEDRQQLLVFDARTAASIDHRLARLRLAAARHRGGR